MNLKMKNLTIAIGVTLVLAGCVGEDKKNGIDFYDPVPTDTGLQLLGDSYLDFESTSVDTPYEAYIPTFLNQYATQYHGSEVIYRDRSVSGSKLDYILGGQYESAREEGVQTLVINGGANDLREPCASSVVVDEEGNYVPITGCEDALIELETKIETFFQTLVSQDHVNLYGEPPQIVWLGRYNFPSTVTHFSVVDRVSNIISGICESENYSNICTYVDTRDAWTVAEADTYLLSQAEDPYADDGPIHVNELGGQVITGILWGVISNPANNFYF